VQRAAPARQKQQPRQRNPTTTTIDGLVDLDFRIAGERVFDTMETMSYEMRRDGE
jgi:hypothetical protein